MRWLSGAVALVAAAVLYGVHQQQGLAAQLAGLAGEVRSLRSLPATPVEAAPACAGQLDPRERQLLVELIAARLEQSPARAPQVPAKRDEPGPAPVAPTAAQQAAAAQAERVLDEALSSGTLRAEQVRELRRLSILADPAAFQELRRRLAVAINRDELKPADPSAGMP